MPSEREQKVDEFVAITGSSKQAAESLLAVCNDNLEMAINMHMEGVQIEDNNSRSSSASNGTQPGTSSSSTAAAAHIDDPDDDGKNFKDFKSHYSKSHIFVPKLNFDKTATFSRVFHPKTRQFSREIKVEFLDKKWRFRTVYKLE